jgi:polyisoprenoid-binding protein YceI
MSTTAVEIPGYVAGTYTIDPGHSDVAFTVRHLMSARSAATSPASWANSPWHRIRWPPR